MSAAAPGTGASGPVVLSGAEDAAIAIRELTEQDRSLRLRGGGTKLAWGSPVDGAPVEVSTSGLERVLEHNEGDFTVIAEAGVTLSSLQQAVRRAGQRVALDPPLGADESATLGGIAATADTGPLRHRYGSLRDLILGVTVVLPDGTLAKAGGKVIKNVAGYDLMKLFAGSFGTLGVIVELVLRLHPLPQQSCTAVGSSSDANRVAAAAARLADSPLEPEAVDIRWDREGSDAEGPGRGSVLVQIAGAALPAVCDRTVRLLSEEGLDTDVLGDEGRAWEEQRRRQRSESGAVIRVSTEPARLPDVLKAADELGAGVVGRAGHGVFWLRLEPDSDERLVAALTEARRRLPSSYWALLDAPEGVRRVVDPFGLDGLPERALMSSVKRRFDPTNACNPGLMGRAI